MRFRVTNGVVLSKIAPWVPFPAALEMGSPLPEDKNWEAWDAAFSALPFDAWGVTATWTYKGLRHVWSVTCAHNVEGWESTMKFSKKRSVQGTITAAVAADADTWRDGWPRMLEKHHQLVATIISALGGCELYLLLDDGLETKTILVNGGGVLTHRPRGIPDCVEWVRRMRAWSVQHPRSLVFFDPTRMNRILISMRFGPGEAFMLKLFPSTGKVLLNAGSQKVFTAGIRRFRQMWSECFGAVGGGVEETVGVPVATTEAEHLKVPAEDEAEE